MCFWYDRIWQFNVYWFNNMQHLRYKMQFLGYAFRKVVQNMGYVRWDTKSTYTTNARDWKIPYLQDNELCYGHILWQRWKRAQSNVQSSPSLSTPAISVNPLERQYTIFHVQFSLSPAYISRQLWGRVADFMLQFWNIFRLNIC